MANKGTWKISLGGQPFADYTDIVQPMPDGGGGPDILEIPGYGAAAVAFLNLANQKIPRRFTLTRQHASDTAAHDWKLTAKQIWAGVADVLLTHLDYSGAESIYKISGAKIELDVDEPTTTTTTHLTITGGAAVLQ